MYLAVWVWCGPPADHRHHPIGLHLGCRFLLVLRDRRTGGVHLPRSHAVRTERRESQQWGGGAHHDMGLDLAAAETRWGGPAPGRDLSWRHEWWKSQNVSSHTHAVELQQYAPGNLRRTRPSRPPPETQTWRQLGTGETGLSLHSLLSRVPIVNNLAYCKMLSTCFLV